MCVIWKPNGEAAFHVCCWKSVLKMARSRKTTSSKQRKRSATEASSQAPAMRQAEKLMVVEASKTAETFDSEEDIKKAAKETATLILKARHCIAFTGAGISTSAGLGDFRGKSGKWTEEDSSAVGAFINEAFQQDVHAAATSHDTDMPGSSQKKTKLQQRTPESSCSGARNVFKSDSTSMVNKDDSRLRSTPMEKSLTDENKAARDHTVSNTEMNVVTLAQSPSVGPPAKRLKIEDIKLEVLPVPKEETVPIEMEEVDESETVDYENLRPTYTHEALTLLMQRDLLHFVISQNCDGLHLLSGLPPDRISELHGNVFVEKCSVCHTRFSRNYYVLNDEASQYFEELEDFGKTDLTKPRFAIQCELCGLCHRTGRKCEQKGCRGFLEDTIINFRDNLEESILDKAFDEASHSDLILCLGTTLTVTPACNIVEEAKGPKPLVICNRQKTEKDSKAKVRVFGDCDIFMREVLGHLIEEEARNAWEARREERMKEYNTQREIVDSKKRRRSSSIDGAWKSGGLDTKERMPEKKNVSKK